MLAAVSMVALMAVLWEIYEFISQFFFPPERPMTLPDTMLDFLLGLAGGLVGAVMFAPRSSSGRR